MTDRYEKAALLDFVATIIWPSRTIRLVTTALGEDEFDVIGSWDVDNDTALAWINGNRVNGAITWESATRVALPVTAAYGSQVVILVSPGSGSGYLPRNPAGSVAMLGDLLMGANRITGLGAAVSSSDAVRLDQVQALIRAQLGANYVAKAGDQMAGALLLAADDAAKGTAAVRRNLVALLDGTQDFTGKIKGVSTEDGDPDTTLTTKDWVEAYVQQALADTQAPNQEEVFSTGGSGYTWTVPDGVRKIWVYAKGGKGARGGNQPAGSGLAENLGGLGALGGIISGSIPVTPGAVLSIDVGPNGANGSARGTDGFKYPTSGGGGGGASRVGIGEADEIVGGGGGGGSGTGGRANHTSDYGGAGGPGGTAGQNSPHGVAGGVPGNTIATAGGPGGARKSNGGKNDGTAGSGFASDAFNTTDTFPFQVVTDPNESSGVGLVIIKWYEA